MNELKLKDKLTTIELLEQINHFRGEIEGKRKELKHYDLLKIIRNEFDQEINAGKISVVEYKDKKGELRPMYTLTLSQAKQVLVRESKLVRKAVIKYIETLEEKLKNPFNVPLTYKDALLQLVDKSEEIERLENTIKEQKPKVLFADAVSGSETSISVNQLSKLLNQNGIDIGQIRLFEWLRNNKFLISRKGSDWNTPTQKSMDKGLFEIKENTYLSSDGTAFIKKTPKVTGKGQKYFINKFLNDSF